MEPRIYILPKITDNNEKTNVIVSFDNYPSPGLLKLGYNDIDEGIDLFGITSNSDYKIFNNIDINKKTIGEFGFFPSITTEKAELLEIINIFNLIQSDQDIYTSEYDDLEDILKTKKKDNKIIKKIDSKTEVSLVIHKISSISIDENGVCLILVEILDSLIKSQKIGANMVLQLFDMKTLITVEILNYINSMYEECFVVNCCSSDIFENSRYLVCLGLKKKILLGDITIPNNMYISSIGFNDISNEFMEIIKFINIENILIKTNIFQKMEKYGDIKNENQDEYNNIIINQTNNIKKWINLFSKENSKELLDECLKKSTEKISKSKKIINIEY